MKRHLIAGALFVAVTIPVSAQEVVSGSYPANAPISLEAIHQAVSATFSDPKSGQYKDITVVDGAICGVANFRNASGGYDDFAPFIVEIRNGEPRATIPHEHPAIQYDIVAHSICGPVLGLKPLIP